jgi:CBS domain-containing membrane protein
MTTAMNPTLVRDIMSSPVESLQVGDTLDLAQRMMKEGRIRHLPVVDGQERLIGLITHRKLLAAWVSHGNPSGERPAELACEVPIDMLMETQVMTTSPEVPAWTAARIIEAHKIGCLPVIDQGRLVGIVTAADFVQFARRHLEREAGVA